MMSTATKRHLVNRISVATGIFKSHIDEIVDQFLEELIDALVREGRIELRDFGVFRTVELGERVGRNPKTGEPVEIPVSCHVRFRASKRMREKLNP